MTVRPRPSVLMLGVVSLSVFCSRASARQTAPEAGSQDAAEETALDAREPIPTKEAQSSAQTLIRKLYRERLQSRDRSILSLAAAELFASAQSPTVDSATRYVLLNESLAVFMQLRDVAGAATAIDEMARTFRVDALKRKLEVGDSMSRGQEAAPPERLFDYYVQIAWAAFDAKNLGQARAAAREAGQQLERVGEADVRRSLTSDHLGLNDAIEDATAYPKLVEACRAKPDDMLAKQRLGWHLCCRREDWAAGLEYLAEAPDASLNSLARIERGNPATAREKLDLADQWWTLSKTKNSEPEVFAIRRHAIEWYRRAKPGFDPASVEVMTIDHRIDEQRADPVAGYSSASPPDTEQAVIEGLRWLARHRNEDGSWGVASVRKHCKLASCVPAGERLSNADDVGLTGLALLALLGKNFEPVPEAVAIDAKLESGEVSGMVVTQGLLWLIKKQRADGGFTTLGAPNMYNHAIATRAMCEAYGATKDERWKASAQKAVDYLLRAQKVSPKGQGLWGWRYASREDLDPARFTDGTYEIEVSDADTSVTGWAVMALKSARVSGLAVPKESLDGATDFIRWVSLENGMVGYVDREQAGLKIRGVNDHFIYHPATMSSVSLLVRMVTVGELGDPFLEPAAKEIVKDLPSVTPDRLSIDYYYWYYATLALNQFDGSNSPRKSGKYWKPWKDALVSALLESQDKNAANDACSRGGWLIQDRWSYVGGPVYQTAMCALALESYYPKREARPRAHK